MDEFYSSFKFWISEYPVHTVALALEWHLDERLIFFDLFAVLGNAEKISTVIPEESSFTQIFKGLEGWKSVVYIVFGTWLVVVATDRCILHGSVWVDT